MSSKKLDFEIRDSAFQCRLQTVAIMNREHTDIQEFLNDCFPYFEKNISKQFKNRNFYKVNACLVTEFKKVPQTNIQSSQTIYIQTKNQILNKFSDLNEFYEEFIVKYCLEHIDKVLLEGSSLALTKITELIVHLNKYEPIGASSYIKLPEFLQNKKAIINVQNQDIECFKWAILSALYPANANSDKVSSYRRYDDELNFDGLTFPIVPHDITKFEKQNPTISINVYEFNQKDKRIYPLRLTKEVKSNHIHLLLLTEETEENVANSHYCWIKSFGRLLTAQVTKNAHKYYFCDRCLNHFKNQQQLLEHRIACENQNSCAIEMPNKMNNKIKFKNLKKQLQVPFIIYADIETLLQKPTQENFTQTEKTVTSHQHHPYSVGFYFKCTFDESKSFYSYDRGPKCIEWFINELKNISDMTLTDLKTKIPMDLTEQDKINFEASTKCHICERDFDEYRVRDHSHLTGEYRGAAHSDCNLHYQESRTIPIVFHNLSNYDSHFLIRQLAQGLNGQISIIPTNMEKFISFTKTVTKGDVDYKKCIKLQFIDSFRFMSESLDKLASLLPPEKMTTLRSVCDQHEYSERQQQLLQHKGVLPYEYLDSFDKLNEASLPSRDAFYNQMTKETVSIKQYEFAKEIWNEFNVKTLGEYTDIYLRTDVLLLADVFENFRKTCLNIYKLDPAHYVSAPSLSWDAMLKYTNVKLELLTDVDQLLFVEKGIRGGISQCTKRYAKANNKYMRNYNENADSNYLIYLDCNNLYGHSMMQPLPIDDFKWSTDKFDTKKVLEHSDDDPIGYFLEVDLKYPNELHDKHNDFPFCGQTESPPNSKAKKLLLTLHDKKNYVIHYKMLKEALKHGLILEKVHRVLQFKQSKWLEPYILLNTRLRTEATNEFDKNFYKLLSNAVYGKTMENLRKRVNIKLCQKWQGRYGAAKVIAHPRFKRRTILDENLALIQKKRAKILMDKPISIGMAILDISKAHMYDFHYDFIKPKYGENVEIVYTDTDSFIYEIRAPCFYSDMKANLKLNKSKFDTSDYPKENQFGIPRKNKKIPGLFKDELKSKIITEFVGLRSKMYSIKTDEFSEEMKKAKGIKKSVIENEISFDDYLNCLKKNETIERSQSSFKSQAHIVSTIEQKKIALSSSDDKRYILEGGFNTLAWGHYSLHKKPEPEPGSSVPMPVLE